MELSGQTLDNKLFQSLVELCIPFGAEPSPGDPRNGLVPFEHADVLPRSQTDSA